MDVVDALYLVTGLLILILIFRPRRVQRRHRWYEVDSTDIAHAERKKKGGKPSNPRS